MNDTAESFEDFERRISSANFRFAVGSPEAGYSTPWTAFRRGNDYYIGARHFMGSTKISLHESGICRVALTEHHYQQILRDKLEAPPDRAIVKWTRKATPEQGAVHVATIIFPTDYLRATEPKGTLKKPQFIFAAAPAGKAVEFGFFYSRENLGTLEPKLSQIGNPIVHTTLDCGDTISIVERVIDFDRTLLPSQEQMDNAPGRVLSTEIAAIEAAQGKLTGMFWNAPGEGGSLMLIEAGGISLRRNP